jgi:hypothetical protein
VLVSFQEIGDLTCLQITKSHKRRDEKEN